jgi:hypothetical protein
VENYGGWSTPRPRRPEPSWPTVIATTARLWLERHGGVSVRAIGARRLIAIAAVLVVVAGAAVAGAVIEHGATAATAGGATAATGHGATAVGTLPRQAGSNASSVAALQVAAETRDQAAGWVAGQVAADAIVACDPAMCAALLDGGVSAGRLLLLGTTATDPLGADVVVETPALRAQFGTRLDTVYAPMVMASFGSGAGRIDVRAVAPDGAAAYESALAADQLARIAAGRQLLGNRRISVSANARAALRSGEVDPRMLVVLAALAATVPVRIVAFDDSSPGASPGVPLRGAEISPAGTGAVAKARLESILLFLGAQQSPFIPALSSLVGTSAVNVEYSAPSPLGLLSGP